MDADCKEDTVRQTIFGIIGGGWRAEFYLRIAEALPDRFAVAGMMVRNPAKGEALQARWAVSTYRTLEELLEVPGMDFVVVAVPWPVTPVMLKRLAYHGMPALSETPPAPDLDGLLNLHVLTERGAKIQVSEQYQFQPLHAARLQLVRSGLLGAVSQAQVSAAHGYHGVSLIRSFLDAGFEGATIWAREFVSSIVSGPGRGGPPQQERLVDSRQVVAHLDFGDKLGVYDFTGDQYFSWIRSPRVLVRGEKGEINNSQVRYLRDFETPVCMDLRRENAGEDGNLEGYFLKGILAGEEWVYRNPYAPARLSDDEIAVATCLDKMVDYVRGGPSFCSLREASQDHYLALMIAKAVETGEPVVVRRPSWAPM
jgi:predicted dehydrogenase